MRKWAVKKQPVQCYKKTSARRAVPSYSGVMTMEDTPDRQALELAKKFEGKEVHVFTTNGVNLRGKAHFAGGWVYVKEPYPSGKSVMCNLAHVISITKG